MSRGTGPGAACRYRRDNPCHLPVYFRGGIPVGA